MTAQRLLGNTRKLQHVTAEDAGYQPCSWMRVVFNKAQQE